MASNLSAVTLERTLNWADFPRDYLRWNIVIPLLNFSE